MIYNCKFCTRVLGNKGALSVHEKHCKNNPNYIPKKVSKNAGCKKGVIPWNKGKSTGRSPKWDEKYSLESVLVENSSYPRHRLKKRIIDNKLIEYHCAICNIDAIWNDKEMPLVLDHINGINDDNRLENLRFICSNCDSQLPTYKSRNRRRKPIGGGR